MKINYFDASSLNVTFSILSSQYISIIIIQLNKVVNSIQTSISCAWINKMFFFFFPLFAIDCRSVLEFFPISSESLNRITHFSARRYYAVLLHQLDFQQSSRYLECAEISYEKEEFQI